MGTCKDADCKAQQQSVLLNAEKTQKLFWLKILSNRLCGKGLERKYKCNIIYRLYCTPIPFKKGVKMQKSKVLID